MKTEDLRIELKALQRKDTENAITKGFNNKYDWFKFIIKQNTDEIAQSIQEIAQRYQINENIIAFHFDPTMIIRLNKLKSYKI